MADATGIWAWKRGAGRAWLRSLSWMTLAGHDRAAGATVRLLGAPLRAPATPDEARAVALLEREGPMTLDRLIDGLAGDMYRGELRRGGWAAEIAVPGRAMFHADAARAVAAGAGALWVIDPASGGS